MKSKKKKRKNRMKNKINLMILGGLIISTMILLFSFNVPVETFIKCKIIEDTLIVPCQVRYIKLDDNTYKVNRTLEFVTQSKNERTDRSIDSSLGFQIIIDTSNIIDRPSWDKYGYWQNGDLKVN